MSNQVTEFHVMNEYMVMFSRDIEDEYTFFLLIPPNIIKRPYRKQKIVQYKLDDDKLIYTENNEDQKVIENIPKYARKIVISADIYCKSYLTDFGNKMVSGIDDKGKLIKAGKIAKFSDMSDEDIKNEQELTKLFLMSVAGKSNKSSQLATEKNLEEGYSIVLKILNKGGIEYA